MEKAEKESLMSLLLNGTTTATTSPADDSVNLHSILSANTTTTTQPLLPLSLFADTYRSLATPKLEQPPHHQPQYAAVSNLNDYSAIFNHLPDLLTLDNSPYKRSRLLDSSHHHLYPSPVAPRGSSLARKRRQSMSDKTRCLQKLLPWEHKMDTAAMLESAHRYVRFLQAQVAALHAMPIVASDSSGSLPVLTRDGGGGGGDEVEVLSRLSRNQLLQVILNSPVAQMKMSEQGRCLFSVEQLALMNKRSAIRSAIVSAAALGSGHYYPSATGFFDYSSASASTTN